MEKMTFEEIQKHNEDARQALIDLYEQRYPCYPDELVVDEVMQNILNYCNREDFPLELRFVAIQMVYVVCNPDQAVQGKTISVGDTRVELGKSDLARRAESVLLDFTSQLQRFRKLRW